MAEKRKSLGRGLDALLGGITQEQKNNTANSLNELPIEEVGPGPFQPRKKIDEQQLSELSASIEAQGILQPIVVRERAVQDSQTGIRYEIIAGERRWRAAQLANLETIPAVVKIISDIDAVAIALIENIQRENLNPLEEANAFHRLIIEYEMTHQEVANSVGRARASISNMLRLLDLPSSVQELLNNNLVAEKKLSVRETEKLVKSIIEGKTKDKKQAQKKDQDIINLESKLTNQLGAKVTIKHKQSGAGSLIINYTNTDELEGILNKIK